MWLRVPTASMASSFFVTHCDLAVALVLATAFPTPFSSGRRTLSSLLVESRHPQTHRQVVSFGRAGNVARPEFLYVAGLEQGEIEYSGIERGASRLRRLPRGFVLSLLRARSYRIKNEELQILEPVVEDRGHSVFIRIGQDSDRHVFRVNPVFLVQCATAAGRSYQPRRGRARRDVDDVDVCGCAHEFVVQADGEAADAVHRNRARSCSVDVGEEEIQGSGIRSETIAQVLSSETGQEIPVGSRRQSVLTKVDALDFRELATQRVLFRKARLLEAPLNLREPIDNVRFASLFGELPLQDGRESRGDSAHLRASRCPATSPSRD